MTLDTFFTAVAIVSTLSTLSGSFMAFLIDFYRRKVRSKAADYIVSSQMERLTISIETMQNTLEDHMTTSDRNHLDMCQRVARLEGKYSG